MYRRVLGKRALELAERLWGMTNQDILRQHIVAHSAQTLALETLKERLSPRAREFLRAVVKVGESEGRLSKVEASAILEMMDLVNMNTISRANASLTLMTKAFDEQFEPAVNLLIEGVLRAKWGVERNKITCEDALEAIYQVVLQAIGMRDEVYGGSAVVDDQQEDQHVVVKDGDGVGVGEESE